jgi:hypothetical protein
MSQTMKFIYTFLGVLSVLSVTGIALAIATLIVDAKWRGAKLLAIVLLALAVTIIIFVAGETPQR